MDEPVARVERVGRWTYRVYVLHGIGLLGPDGYGWHVLGRERAIRKARHVLARYRRELDRQASVVEIRESDG